MQRIRYYGWSMVAVFLLVCATSSAHGQAAGVDAKIVKFPELIESIKQHKGKIVVVDCWSLTCIECMKKFPHLVEMNKKYSKDGLVAVSLDLDPVDKDTREKVLVFLRKQNATFPNLILDEADDVWQKKLKISALPSVFIFDREGKVAKKYTDEVNYDQIEKDVLELLKKQ